MNTMMPNNPSSVASKCETGLGFKLDPMREEATTKILKPISRSRKKKDRNEFDSLTSIPPQYSKIVMRSEIELNEKPEVDRMLNDSIACNLQDSEVTKDERNHCFGNEELSLDVNRRVPGDSMSSSSLEVQRELERSALFIMESLDSSVHDGKQKSEVTGDKNNNDSSSSDESHEITNPDEDDAYVSSSRPRSYSEPQIDMAASIDLSTLHLQVESEEPISYSFLGLSIPEFDKSEPLLSPRSFRGHIDSMSVAPSPPILHDSNMFNESNFSKTKTLTGELHSLKIMLKRLEDEFEEYFGYKPSHNEKIHHKKMRKCLVKISKIRKQLDGMKQNGTSMMCSDSSPLGRASLSNSMEFTGEATLDPLVPGRKENYWKDYSTKIHEIDLALVENRRTQNRGSDLNDMSMPELFEEKNAMQKQLLALERRYGRPETKEQKAIAHDLYHRYRTVKKMCRRSESCDLVPIIEHVPLETSRNTVKPPPTSPVSEFDATEAPDSQVLRGYVATDDDCKALTEISEGFNGMNLAELEAKQRELKEEKQFLKSTVRSYETEFQRKNGRRFRRKDDAFVSTEMEQNYKKYKTIRASLKLLNVLIRKKKFIS